MVFDTTASFIDRAANTPYTVRVAALCDGTDTSMILSSNFRTPCNFISALPFIHNFESDPTSSSTTGSAFVNCWTRLNNGSSSSYPYIYSSAANAHTGTNVLYFYLPSSSTPNEEAMVLPEIDTSLTPIFQTEVAFWAKASVTNRKLYLGVVSDPVSLSSIDIVDSVVLSLIPTEYVLNASSYGGSGTRLALYAKRDTTATV